MIVSKLAETFAEAIPAGALQAYAFTQSENRSMSAFASILISALTTGFGSALVSYGESSLGFEGDGPGWAGIGCQAFIQLTQRTHDFATTRLGH